MDIQHLPIIDWELAMKMAGNKRDIAEEILTLLIRNLSNDISAINQSYQNKRYQELASQLHKLHGALCYCGLPRIKTLVARLEIDIKNNNIDNLARLMESLNNEVKLLLEYHSA